MWVSMQYERHDIVKFIDYVAHLSTSMCHSACWRIEVICTIVIHHSFYFFSSIYFFFVFVFLALSSYQYPIKKLLLLQMETTNVVGCVFGFGGKFWVFLYLPLIFSPILNTQRKLEWFIYQLFYCLLLECQVMGHLSTRACTPDRFGLGARPWPAVTNAAPFKGSSRTCYILKILFLFLELTLNFWAK